MDTWSRVQPHGEQSHENGPSRTSRSRPRLPQEGDPCVFMIYVNEQRFVAVVDETKGLNMHGVSRRSTGCIPVQLHLSSAMCRQRLWMVPEQELSLRNSLL